MMCKLLNSNNQYNADLFLEEISQVLQSNDTSMSDDELEFVTVQNRSGGRRKSINKIPYDKILSEKTRFLYNPDNAGNLCFSLCLAHFKKTKSRR